MGTLLDMTVQQLEKVLYFENYVVTHPGDTPLKEKELLNEEAYRKKTLDYGWRFKAGMGAEAIRELLKNVNIDVLTENLNQQMRKASSLKVKRNLLRS